MDSKKKRYIGGAIVIVLLLILFAGHVKKNGGIVTPKEVSFGKTSGERIWYGTENGKGKDALIDYVYVTKGKKMIQYQIFDNDITLGKVSKMGNDEVINLAKKQDRKYFDKSIDEVKSLRDKKGQIGLQNDMWGDKQVKNDVATGPTFFLVGDKSSNGDQWSNTKLVTREQFHNYYSDYHTHHAGLGTLGEGSINESLVEDHYDEYKKINEETTNKRYNYLINYMKTVKYLAPKWQTVKYSDTKTDDTGNNVTEQTVSYKSIDEFGDYDSINNSIFTLPKSKQQQIASILTKYHNYTNPTDQKDVNVNELKNDFNGTFDDSYYKAFAKSVFHPHTFDDGMTLHDPTSQTIYDSEFIGYQYGDDNYLLTKAQNDHQKAVLSK